MRGGSGTEQGEGIFRRRMFDRIDHVGIAVEDLDGALALFEGTFGMPAVHRETVEEQGVEAALLDVGENHVELLRPLGPDTPVGRFLARNGPGMHHVAFQVDNVAAAADELAGRGVSVIDPEPRPGLGGHAVSFVHPDSLHGVLAEVLSPRG